MYCAFAPSQLSCFHQTAVVLQAKVNQVADLQADVIMVVKIQQ